MTDTDEVHVYRSWLTTAKVLRTVVVVTRQGGTRAHKHIADRPGNALPSVPYCSICARVQGRHGDLETMAEPGMYLSPRGDRPNLRIGAGRPTDVCRPRTQRRRRRPRGRLPAANPPHVMAPVRPLRLAAGGGRSAPGAGSRCQAEARLQIAAWQAPCLCLAVRKYIHSPWVVHMISARTRVSAPWGMTTVLQAVMQVISCIGPVLECFRYGHFGQDVAGNPTTYDSTIGGLEQHHQD